VGIRLFHIQRTYEKSLSFIFGFFFFFLPLIHICAISQQKAEILIAQLSAADHQNWMIAKTGIAELRPRSSGNLLQPNAANSDESKAILFYIATHLFLIRK